MTAPTRTAAAFASDPAGTALPAGPRDIAELIARIELRTTPFAIWTLLAASAAFLAVREDVAWLWHVDIETGAPWLAAAFALAGVVAGARGRRVAATVAALLSGLALL